ncbi:MAG: hypothetical protein U1E93_06840 [Alphaproteobacteria bacterium]
MEPAEPGATPATPVPAPEQPRQQQPRQERPHQEQKPRHENRPPRHEKRERGSQRQHNEQAARPEAVDKSELPAFLFRPVPVRKPEPQPE